MSDPGAAAPPDVTALAGTVTQLRRALRRRTRARGPAGQLPLAQVELLQHLAEHPGARVGDVATDLHLAGNTVSTLVRRLAGAGLLTRSADTRDRRAAALRLTPAGARRLAGWQRLQGTVIAEALHTLDPRQRDALARAQPALAALAAAIGALEPAAGAATAASVARTDPATGGDQAVGPPAT